MPRYRPAMPRLLTRRDLTDDENRVLRAVCLLALLVLVVPSSYVYLLLPMLTDFGAGSGLAALFRALPSIASLLVIFPAGGLAMRLGPRRVLVASGVLVTVGSAAVLMAPGAIVALVGMVLLSVGRSVLLIIIIALLTAATTREGARHVAFSAYGAVDSAAFVVAPVFAGLLVTVVSWRAVAALWVLSGMGLVVVARSLVSPDGERPAVLGELWTPAAAGVALTAMVQAFFAVDRSGWASLAVLGWGAVALAALAVLAVLMGRIPAPTVNPAVLRRGGLLLLLLVVVLIPFANLWFYTNAKLQYVYGISALGAAFLAAPAQMASVAGAALMDGFIKAKGITKSGTTMLVAAAATLFAAGLQTGSTPVVVLVVVLCLYGASVAAAEVALATAVMNRSVPGTESTVASFRGAAVGLGGALGVIFMSTVVSIGVHQAYAERSEDDLGRDQLMEVLRAVHEGQPTAEIAGWSQLPESEIEGLAAHETEAMVVGFRSQAIGGALVTLGAAGVFYVARRRHPDED